MPDLARARALSRVAPVVSALLLGTLLLLVPGLGPRVVAQGKKPTRKAPVWTVVKVGDKHRAVLASELGALRKEIASENRSVLAEWTKARAAARKKKEKFTDPRPKSLAVKTTGLKLASKEEAEERAAQLDAEGGEKKSRPSAAKKELWAAVQTASGGEVVPRRRGARPVAAARQGTRAGAPGVGHAAQAGAAGEEAVPRGQARRAAGTGRALPLARGGPAGAGEGPHEEGALGTGHRAPRSAASLGSLRLSLNGSPPPHPLQHGARGLPCPHPCSCG
jgi:hypothetical protein